MKRRMGWILGAGAFVALAAAGVWGVRAWTTQRQVERTVAARKAFLARFGIDSDGRQAFIALPAQLPHALGPAQLGADLFCDRRLGQKIGRAHV